MIDTYGTDITDKELAAMPYTTAIVKETLRQKAIVSSVWRKTLVDIELGGYRIPKVSPLIIADSCQVLHDVPVSEFPQGCLCSCMCMCTYKKVYTGDVASLVIQQRGNKCRGRLVSSSACVKVGFNTVPY